MLDIGCWDGFNRFAAHRRGAMRVLATDHFVWHDPDWHSRGAFDLARAHISPVVEVMDIKCRIFRPLLTVDRFDIVLLAGVLYHLRHPFQMFEKIAQLSFKPFRSS